MIHSYDHDIHRGDTYGFTFYKRNPSTKAKISLADEVARFSIKSGYAADNPTVHLLLESTDGGTELTMSDDTFIIDLVPATTAAFTFTTAIADFKTINTSTGDIRTYLEGDVSVSQQVGYP